MEPEMIARAQFDRRAANAQSTLASKYAFETPIEEDKHGAYYHHLTITRLADGVTVADEKHYTREDLDDAISNWRSVLGISHMCTAMMGL